MLYLIFLTTLLCTVACHVTRVSLFRTALCCDQHVTIKPFDFDWGDFVLLTVTRRQWRDTSSARPAPAPPRETSSTSPPESHPAPPPLASPRRSSHSGTHRREDSSTSTTTNKHTHTHHLLDTGTRRQCQLYDYFAFCLLKKTFQRVSLVYYKLKGRKNTWRQCVFHFTLSYLVGWR